jgi:hypothetical protein
MVNDEDTSPNKLMEYGLRTFPSLETDYWDFDDRLYAIILDKLKVDASQSSEYA